MEGVFEKDWFPDVSDSDDNELNLSIIDSIVDNLVSVGKRYEMVISGSTSGRNSMSLYYENLDNVIESMFLTVAKSNLAKYKGCVYLFTGKIYEPIPGHSHLSWAVRTYLRKSGVPKEFIMRSLKQIVSAVYKSLDINRVLHPRYNVMAFENGVVDMKDGILRPFSRDFHVVYLHRYVFRWCIAG